MAPGLHNAYYRTRLRLPEWQVGQEQAENGGGASAEAKAQPSVAPCPSLLHQPQEAPSRQEGLSHLATGGVEVAPGLLRLEGRDGPDFQRVCHVHGWASQVSAIRVFGSWDACPRCVLHEREAAGRVRYAALVLSGVIHVE